MSKMPFNNQSNRKKMKSSHPSIPQWLCAHPEAQKSLPKPNKQLRCSEKVTDTLSPPPNSPTPQVTWPGQDQVRSWLPLYFSESMEEDEPLSPSLYP